MAVYVAASDESDGPTQKGPFVYGGFFGPSRDWIDWFAPAWEERVLNIKPPLPYFHMAEIRNPRWQAKNGWTQSDADSRIDEAVRVVASMGSIHFGRTSFDGGHFRQIFGSARMQRAAEHQVGTYPFEPDYIGFVGFARGALEYVHANCPDVERVDFLVERKQRVSHYIPDYLTLLRQWLQANGAPGLVELVGEVLPVDKTRVPVQAADLAMWHIRRYEAGESDPIDIRRTKAMFHWRSLTLSGVTNDEISGLHARYRARVEIEKASGEAS